MARFSLFEPEEAIGTLWHGLAGDLDRQSAFPEAAVELDAIRDSLAVTFRGLGGAPSVELKAAPAVGSGHRLSWRRRLGRDRERLHATRFDGETLFLPPRLDVLPSRRLNRRLYLWLVAWSVSAEPPAATATDPLQRDLLRLRAMRRARASLLEVFPGLRPICRELEGACLAQRPQRHLPPAEQRMERCIRMLLGDSSPSAPDERELLALIESGTTLSGIAAPRGYRAFLPVPLWGERQPPPPRRAGRRSEGEEEPGTGSEPQEETTLRARRDRSDQADRKDSLILHRFEAILSWTEFLNLNRMVDNDDELAARRAAEDQDRLSLVELSKRPATRLKFDLDLAPEDVDRERLSGEHLYPEWDHRACAYRSGHARVLASLAEQPDSNSIPPADPASLRRIRAVRRQFEALRPRRLVLPRQLDGDELDLDAAVRGRCELLATGEMSNRLYRQARDQTRDLAVLVLFDTSRSTESYIDNRQVLEVEKEALTALAYGLQGCGDDLAILGFSSLKRSRVYIQTVKRFEERMGAPVEARIAALRPGFYTRMGAALRHGSRLLATRSSQRRLLLLLTDGKPNDLDHYEGRYGIEDTRRVVQESRRAGHAVFAVTVDAKARGYLPRIFGGNGYAIVAHPDRLTAALPAIYHHLVD